MAVNTDVLSLFQRDEEPFSGVKSSGIGMTIHDILYIEQDMDKFSADDALDSQIAFYKDEMKYFIGVVTKQVVERHLIDPLPMNTISPVTIAALTDKEVRYLTAEPAATTEERNFLEARKRMLESGQQTFQRMMYE